MGEISYKDFAKLDLRIGTIKNVQTIDGADKLYKLTVSLGKSTRTIVAGMRPYYNSADLFGKKVVVLTNLAPRRLRGVESRGMILAAQDENETVALLKPEKIVNDGAKVL